VDDIGDDEHLLRHIPGGTLWQAPGPRITSASFQLRADRNETGVSVTRRSITSPHRLLELVGGDPQKGSRVAWVRVGDVRQLGLEKSPPPILYIPYRQFALPFTNVAVRSTTSSAAVASILRSALATVDPELPFGEITTLQGALDRSVDLPRFRATLLPLLRQPR